MPWDPTKSSCPICDSQNIPILCQQCKLTAWCSNTCALADERQGHALLHEDESEKDVVEVLPGVWVGGVESLIMPIMEKVQSVLTILPYGRVDEIILKSLLAGKNTLRVKLEDNALAPIEQYFYQTAQWIHEQRCDQKTVLVHCAKGRSRSISMVIAYTMLYPSADDQLWLMQHEKHDFKPNPFFMKKLRLLSLSRQPS